MESLMFGCGGGGGKNEETDEMQQQRYNRVRQPLCLGHRLQLLPCGGRADEDCTDQKAQRQIHQPIAPRKICRFEIKDHYAILRHIGSGTFGNVLLAICLKNQVRIALKKLPKASTKLEDFLREFNYSLRLAAHPVVVKTFDVAFETKTSYVFAQEFAPRSDLLKCVPPRIGLSECKTKAVVRQIGSALEFIHSKEIVHRDVKLENILVFDEKLFRVKLADFGVARQAGTVVCKVCSGTTYTPPEICDQPKGQNYRVETSADVWSFGVVVFCLLTGSFPWQMADGDGDPLFKGFAAWQTGRTDQVPEHWVRFTSVLMRLFRRMLEIRPKKRTVVQTVAKYTDHPWMVRRQSFDRESAHRRQTATDAEDQQCINCREEEKEILDGERDKKHENERAVDGGTSAANNSARMAKVSDWLLSQVSSSSSSAF